MESKLSKVLNLDEKYFLTDSEDILKVQMGEQFWYIVTLYKSMKAAVKGYILEGSLILKWRTFEKNKGLATSCKHSSKLV